MDWVPLCFARIIPIKISIFFLSLSITLNLSLSYFQTHPKIQVLRHTNTCIAYTLIYNVSLSRQLFLFSSLCLTHSQSTLSKPNDYQQSLSHILSLSLINYTHANTHKHTLSHPLHQAHKLFSRTISTFFNLAHALPFLCLHPH